ncbi:5-formyltetrahydrofolate cyclo-ligase [Pseudidiomarina insulisalsae]|uniref:5-formyltetrahydrofolate cyclo-ligase n=1 Tax=Pseudidiomarina insulisalsae TaxID=575789 RepID=A0A432YAD2_9GAMM|nr:5-formyltetrahydrofolate cyclo-ligase [Pseudidiomarina insulisalsae]RUO57940.1 5-formyltetrahydrofolate cyclo-ligase [Pseudidiomarina insulisalsae]
MKRQFSQNNSSTERQQLRKQLLAARQQVSVAERQQGGQAIARQLLALPEMQRTRTVGSYYSVRAELPTGDINEKLQQQGHQLALPVLHPVVKNHLLLLAISDATGWHSNAYGIPEPQLDCRHIVPLAHVDILLVPLVGFDLIGNRLGMGGGFYDRTLAGWRAGHFPQLQPIGLALDCQRVERLPIAPWDVPLPRVITPTKIWDFRS